jgi:hypothetical protein
VDRLCLSEAFDKLCENPKNANLRERQIIGEPMSSEEINYMGRVRPHVVWPMAPFSTLPHDNGYDA